MERRGESVLVVTAETGPVVRYALREARDVASERDCPVDVEFLVPTDAAAAAVRRSVEGMSLPGRVTVATSVAEQDFPTVVERARAGATQVLVDPSVVDPAAVAAALDISVERVPAGRSLRRRRLVHGPGPVRFAAVYLLSFGFYLLLGDPFDPFDLVTGAVTAGVAAVALAPVVFEVAPGPVRTPVRALRAALFLPYLLYGIARANLAMAYVVLHPSLPIDPSMVEYEGAPDGSRLQRAVLANAVTLTPGTLTVDVREDGLLVHALTPGTRADLEAGALARAVAFVFHGRSRDGDGRREQHRRGDDPGRERGGPER